MRSMHLNYNINNEVCGFCALCFFDAFLYTSQRTYIFLYMCVHIFRNASLSVMILCEVQKNAFMFLMNVVRCTLAPFDLTFILNVRKQCYHCTESAQLKRPKSPHFYMSVPLQNMGAFFFFVGTT